MNTYCRLSCSLLATCALFASTANAAIYAPSEDVMTSGFFRGADQVRGYAGDARPTFRVSTPTAFGVGREAIYLDFTDSNLSGFAGKTVNATLTMQSTSGTFGADAGPGSPFTVSAHGVNANPLTEIADDTSLGTISAADFYANNILAAHADAATIIDGFGTFTWDVSILVNDWISGSNPLQFIAMTGKNDTSGIDFLHGFLNNTETPGSTQLQVSAVPVPAAVWLFASAVVGLVGIGRRRQISMLKN